MQTLYIPNGSCAKHNSACANLCKTCAKPLQNLCKTSTIYHTHHLRSTSCPEAAVRVRTQESHEQPRTAQPGSGGSSSSRVPPQGPAACCVGNSLLDVVVCPAPCTMLCPEDAVCTGHSRPSRWTYFVLNGVSTVDAASTTCPSYLGSTRPPSYDRIAPNPESMSYRLSPSATSTRLT